MVGHFGHGHFGLGRFGPNISATDISATENAEGGRFGHNHKFWVWDVCMHKCVMHFLIVWNKKCMWILTVDSKMHDNRSMLFFIETGKLWCILWVRCTINRSHSTPCKKAEFEHLQIFPGHCLDFFLSVSGKICHLPIKKVKRQPTLIISFSQHSPFFGEQSKNPGWNPTRVRRYLGSAPGSLWQNSPHKDAFFYISLTNIDQCWITCTFKVE